MLTPFQFHVLCAVYASGVIGTGFFCFFRPQMDLFFGFLAATLWPFTLALLIVATSCIYVASLGEQLGRWRSRFLDGIAMRRRTRAAEIEKARRDQQAYEEGGMNLPAAPNHFKWDVYSPPPETDYRTQCCKTCGQPLKKEGTPEMKSEKT